MARPALKAQRPKTASGRPRAIGLIAGIAADALLGDPRRHHPVAMFGTVAATAEKLLYQDSVPRGAAYAAACIALAAVPGAAADRQTRRSPGATIAVTAAATWAVTGARSLTGEARKIDQALKAGDMKAARDTLPSLCGRDPSGLDEKAITRAVIESVAENCGDAIVTPMLWGAAGGVTGLLSFRAINTLDAMVGHRSPRLRKFGAAAARADDVANWLPARVTAALTALCAPLVGGSTTHAWRMARTYGNRHPSPNAGWCEAAFAGALGLRLGGVNSYNGVTEHRPELGDGRIPAREDIDRAVRLCRAVTIAATATAAAIAIPR